MMRESPGTIGLVVLLVVLLVPFARAWLRELRRRKQRELWSKLPPDWRP